MIHAFKFLGLAIVLISCLSNTSLAQDRSDDSYQADELARKQFERALTSLNANQNDTAIRYFEDALDNYSLAENGEGVYTSGIYLAIALKKEGRLEDLLAFDRIFQSHPIDSDSLSAQLRLSLSASFFEKGDYEEALDNIRHAQDRIENIKNNDLLHFRILENKAKIYRKINYPQGEEKTYSEIDKLVGTNNIFLLEEDRLELKLNKALAFVSNPQNLFLRKYFKLNRLKELYESYEMGLSMERKQDALRKLGDIYLKLEDYKQATAYYQKYKKILSNQNQAFFHANYQLARIAYLDGKTEVAKKEIGELLSKEEDSGLNPHKRARLFFMDGELKKADRQFEEAIRQYQEVFKIWKPDHRSQSVHQIPSLEDLAAEPLNQQVLWSYAECLQGMAEQNEKAANALLESSLAAFQKALEFGDKLRKDAFIEDEEPLSLNKIRPKFEEAIQLAVKLGQTKQDDRFIGIAFQFQQAAKIEENREIFLQYYRRQGVPWEMEEESRRKIYLQRLKDLDAEIAEIPFKEERQVLASIRENVKDDFEQFRQSLRYGDPAYFKLKEQIAQSSISDLRAELGNYELLLSMFKGEEKLYLFELRKDMIDLRIIEIGAKGMKPYLEFIEMVQHKQSSAHSFNEMAYAFYQELLEKPLTDSTQSIIIVPDGIFHLFPFETLYTASSASLDFGEQPYLIRKYPIRYHRHSTELLPSKDYFSRNYQHKYAMFMPYQKDQKSMGFIDSLRLKDEERIAISNSDFPLLNQQAAYMEKRRKQMGAEIFSGRRASERNFRGYGKDYHSVEMAGYVVSSDDNPLYSGLNFFPQKDEGHYLAVHEILRNNLNNDLLILPNHAAIGKLKNGMGFRSLVYSLETSKVQNLIISQWMMEEYGNQIVLEDLIKRLYVGTGKARALQQAKLSYLKEQENTHPYYWAGLVLYGDNIELEGEERPWWSYGALLFALLMVFIIIFGFRRKRDRR